MTKQCEPETIEEVLDCMEDATEGMDRVAIGDIVERIGDGAFAPLMLLPALVMVSPATAIFGLATLCGALIAIVACQMLAGQKKLWLPQFILKRRLSARHVERVVSFLTTPARTVDGLTRARLSFLVSPPVDRVWAAICVLLAVLVPIFELVPMSATIIGAAISLFGLAILAKDGLLALTGVLILGLAVSLVWNVAT